MNFRIILRNFTVVISDNDVNKCKYCKNRIVTLDRDRLFSDRCKKFINSDNSDNIHTNILYELAYNARKDENKCGKFGIYYEDKY